MTGHRLKIVNIDDEGDTPRQSYVLDAACSAIDDLVVTEMYSVNGGAILLIENLEHIHGLLSKEAQDILKTFHLKALQPEWMSPDKTLFATRVPLVLTEDRGAQEVAKEIHRCNPNLKIEYLLIIRGRQNPRFNQEVRDTIKITFVNADMADVALSQGIKLFNYSLKPEALEKERFVKVTQCYKCFSLNHKTSECERMACLCSICGGEHHYRRCPRPDNPRCINCHEKHHAVSRYCKKKKEKMEEIKARNIRGQEERNAGIIHNPQEYPGLESKTDNQKDLDQLQTYSESILTFKFNSIDTYANMKAEGDPELYMKIINQFLKDHDLKEIPHPLRHERIPNTQGNHRYIGVYPNGKNKRKPVHHESENEENYDQSAYALMGTLPDNPSPIPLKEQAEKAP